MKHDDVHEPDVYRATETKEPRLIEGGMDAKVWIRYALCTRCAKMVALMWNDSTTLRCPCGGELKR